MESSPSQRPRSAGRQNSAIGFTGDAVPRCRTSGATVSRNSQRCSSAQASASGVELEVVDQVQAHRDDRDGVDRQR